MKRQGCAARVPPQRVRLLSGPRAFNTRIAGQVEQEEAELLAILNAQADAGEIIHVLCFAQERPAANLQLAAAR